MAQPRPPLHRPERRRRLRGLCRILAPRLSELLGQPVVVDNKPGANGTIGMQELQRSPPDGYTFMFAHVGAISIGTSVYPSMPLDPVEDLASIAVAVTSPLVWLVNPATPFRSLPDMVARVQAEPGTWRYALPASGSIPHLVMEDFSCATGWTSRRCPIAARRNR